MVALNRLRCRDETLSHSRSSLASKISQLIECSLSSSCSSCGRVADIVGFGEIGFGADHAAPLFTDFLPGNLHYKHPLFTRLEYKMETIEI